MRTNGFQRPYTNDQISVIVAHPLLLVLYYSAISLVLPFKQYAWAYIAVAVPAAIAIFCWYTIESEDPADLKKTVALGRLNRGRRWEGERYCGACRKTVPGLDHHCTWLNTCVARRNYPAFVALALAGLLQMILQSLVLILTVALWVPRRKLKASFWALAVPGAAGAAAAAVALGSLLGFHALLTARQTSTYAWVLDQHLRDRQEIAEREFRGGAPSQGGKEGRRPGGARAGRSGQKKSSQHSVTPLNTAQQSGCSNSGNKSRHQGGGSSSSDVAARYNGIS